MSANPTSSQFLGERIPVPRLTKPALDTEWFKAQMRKQNLSQRSVAKKLGINQSLISHMFFGRRRMTLEEADKWAKILQVPLIEVLDRSGLEGARKVLSLDEKATCPIVGSITDDLISDIYQGTPLGTAANPTGEKHVAALRFETLNGPFKGLFGALLYFRIGAHDFGQNGVEGDIINRLCVVRARGVAHYLIRVVDRGFEAGTFTLSLLNGEVREKNVSLVFATPVIWIKLR